MCMLYTVPVDVTGRGSHGDYHRTPTTIYILFTVLFIATDLHCKDLSTDQIWGAPELPYYFLFL